MTSFKLLEYLDNISACVAFTLGIIHLAVWATVFTLYNLYPLNLYPLLLHKIPRNIKQATVKALCLLSKIKQDCPYLARH